MNTFLSEFAPRPPDPLLGISEALKADPRDGKVDLGVGIYKDSDGNTPILGAVKAAEKLILERQTTKAYEGPRGNAGFCAAIEKQVFGDQSEALSEGRVASFTAPGGCGAIFLAMSLAARVSQEGRVWISSPSWPNHLNLAAAAGREALGYPYVDAETGTVAFEEMMDALRHARAGDIVIIQGPCHNPTGVDLDLEQWAYLGDFCARQMLFPLIDVAYHGFGDGLEADIEGVRAFLAACPETMTAYSCSKNFGLYRERAGCFLLQAETGAAAAAAASHVAEIARAVYSMPPAHGAAIVETILTDEALTAQWREELGAMRDRMQRLRNDFAAALEKATGSDAFASLAHQKGMFSMLPLQGPVTEMLRLQFGIYMPGSGRINIAGLPEDGLETLAGQMAPFLTAALAQHAAAASQA
ncbi:MAG: amino acid aminotransferase [Pseudomonadota bacterium]